MTFEEWFAKRKFRNFSVREFTGYFERALNSTPPRGKWGNMIATLRIVDDLRDHFGKPCTILSSYRSPAYNRKVGGVARSRHLEFDALDIRIKGVSARRVYELLKEWRRDGKFKGGLGLYVRSRFVHIDTRGRNATWRGN